MALTTAQLIGTPARADENDLDTAVEIGKKATGGSSAIAVGRVVFHTHATGVWAIATAGSTGRMGVVPKLAPANVDADDTLQVVAAPKAQIYVEATGAIKPGAQLLPDTGGKVKASTGQQGFAVYKGHYGEGSGLENDPTDAAAAEAVRIELSGDVI
jgi:hypothetical protein